MGDGLRPPLDTARRAPYEGGAGGFGGGPEEDDRALARAWWQGVWGAAPTGHSAKRALLVRGAEAGARSSAEGLGLPQRGPRLVLVGPDARPAF